jgi:hypothetical protein
LEDCLTRIRSREGENSLKFADKRLLGGKTDTASQLPNFQGEKTRALEAESEIET